MIITDEDFTLHYLFTSFSILVFCDNSPPVSGRAVVAARLSLFIELRVKS